MAKNQELIASIVALAAEKNTDVPITEGLNNAQLAETLKGMKTPASPAPAKPAGPKDKDDVAEPAKVKRPPFYITDGHSLTTLKGILGPGDEVQSEYLIDGEKGINRHREGGVIAKG